MTQPDARSRRAGSGAMIRRVARVYLAPRWRALTATFLFAVIFAVLSGVLVKILQPAVNDLAAIAEAARRPGHAAAAAIAGLGRLAVVIVVLALAKGAVQILQARLVNAIGNGVVGDIQLGLFSRLVRADLARLRSSHTGSFVSAVLYDSGLIRDAATGGLVNVVQQGLTLAAMAVVMLLTDWRLSLFVVLAAPVVVLVLRRYSRRAGYAASGAMEATSNLSSAVMESLDGVRVVKIDNREAYEEGRVGAVIAGRQRHIISGDNARATAAPASEALMTVVVAGVLVYEGAQAAAGRMDVGGFLAFFAALLSAGQAVRQLANYPGVLAQALSASQRLFAALDIEPEVRDASGAPALTVADGAIRLEGVRFAYADDEPVLHGVDLVASRGEIVALVGPSGAGKSTVLGLIPRFYDVTAGRLSIDGQDVRDVSLASLRNHIALVTQEPFLFDDTIAANIAYARPAASTAEISAAARAAAADAFIEALPKGYQTLVGQAGARLSGGQRQRIAIARAFLKNAPILLLDEATSALDGGSEAQIQAALGRLMAGRTTLLIAHRLSTVRGADRIYVLDRGRVVEAGAHDDLIARGGLYARLARTQDLDHLPDAAE
jgi:ATP-binding cassette, subfamily B, bacterial MsbA